MGTWPKIFAVLGVLLFLFLRIQRIEQSDDPQADEGAYLHVARYMRDSGQALSAWHFIPRGVVARDSNSFRTGKILPRKIRPYRQSLVQPGLPALLAPWMNFRDPLRAGRILIFCLAILGLAASLYWLWKMAGPWAGAACALFTALSFSQIEYGTWIHTETPMLAITYASLAIAVRGLPTRPIFAAGLACGVAGLGLYFRTNGIFLPLALSLCLFLGRKKWPNAWAFGLGSALVIMAPRLMDSAITFGSPLASESGDILWATSLRDFRAAHEVPLSMSHFLAEQGWQALLLRPFLGVVALASRLSDADYGRTVPLIILGLFGAWKLRRQFTVQVLILGALPTLAVTIWISPVSWCERFIHFLMPACFGFAGHALAAWVEEYTGKFPSFRWKHFVMPVLFLLLLSIFISPHRFWQRKLASESEAAFLYAGLTELENRLAIEKPFALAAFDFTRFNWRTPFAGANIPMGTPMDSVQSVLGSLFGVFPERAVLSREEVQGRTVPEKAWLSQRFLFQVGSFSVYDLNQETTLRNNFGP